VSADTVERVHTLRLVCERLRQEHLPALQALLLDPRVTRTLWPRTDRPTQRDVADSLAGNIDHWQRYGFGLWLVRDRRSRETVGRGGLQRTYVGNQRQVEAGWAIAPERWAQGLATELAIAAVDTGLNALEMPEIIAFTLPDNVASRRVMEKAGFAYEREILRQGLPHVLYRIRGGATAGADSAATLRTSAPLTRSCEARKERVASVHGRPRPQ
jgi:RimJ/RimL family protein N-acetyltransferase